MNSELCGSIKLFFISRPLWKFYMFKSNKFIRYVSSCPSRIL